MGRGEGRGAAARRLRGSDSVGPMVGRQVLFTAVPGQGETLARVMLDVAHSLEGTAGCRLYAISRAVDDNDAIWVTELWDDQESVDASLTVLQTDTGKARLGEVMALLVGPPQRTELQPLGGVGIGD
jgi:quinol monooxygenase YgiN